MLLTINLDHLDLDVVDRMDSEYRQMLENNWE